MNKLLIIILMAAVFSSCMYKSVMEGTADNIVEARIYSFEGKQYLVMLELVYQATSKQGGRGISITTGYNVQRLSVYNLNDGSLVVRKKAGRLDRFALEFLGCTGGNLWFYSLTEGIHSLNPETLEVRVTQETIFEKNPGLRGNLATCEWYQLPQFFQFNDISQSIVLTDNQGYRYLLDPDSLLATKIVWEYQPYDPRTSQNFATSITFPPPTLNLTGELRKQIRLDGKEVNPGLTFLDGKFIVDRNPARVVEGIDRKLSWYMLRMEAIYPELLELTAMNNGRGPSWGTRDRDTLQRLENVRYQLGSDIRNLESCRVDISQKGYSHHYTPLLSPDTTAFFVFHSSGTAKDARVVISRVQRKGNRELTALWTTEIPGLFYNPDAASETNTFREVFSKGSPDFKFSCFEMEANRLIIIWMLHVHCIDMETGEILWKFRV
jgi:hypothetical protein